MKWFSCLCLGIFGQMTMGFATMPYQRSQIFSKTQECKIQSSKQISVYPCKKVSKDCGLCTIERGKWAITPKFAVAPTWYTDRGNTLVIGQVDPTGIDAKKTLSRFDEMFDLTLMYGGHVGYMFRKHIEFFLDLDYTHADGRSTHLHSDLYRIKQHFSAYQAFGAYLGTRLYLAFFQERLTPFLGIKLGYMHRWAVKVHETIVSDAGKLQRHPLFFENDNTVAGSAGIGFDCYFTKWLAFSFETECLISGQRRSATIVNPSPYPIIRVGDTGAMVSVPFTFALKFKI